ncbi:uncharacterized protein zgc:113210 isoform X1 [Anguilla rostrata]|uniref:uncharacterized protein zgc:113210 isoform X1 n=1 Tax=Anguilla rostrata TaxID=7938 RepID=UPI0030D21414
MSMSHESVITFQNQLASIMDVLLKNAVCEITKLFETSLSEIHSINVTQREMEVCASKLKLQQAGKTPETEEEYSANSGSNKTEFETWDEHLCSGTIDVFGHFVSSDNENVTKTSTAVTDKQDGDSHSEDRDFEQRWNCDLWRDGENSSSEARITQTQPIQVKREIPETDSCCSACGKMPVSVGSLCTACTSFSHQGAHVDSQTSSLLQPGMESLRAAMEDVQAAIKRTLPELEAEQLGCLVEHLTGNVGVESSGDLQYVRLKDIQDCLTPIQCQRFLQPCKERDSVGEQALPSCSSSPPPSESRGGCKREPPSPPVCPATLPASPPQVNVSSSWVSNFQVPWERMPPTLREAVAKGHRPRAADRRLMVRLTVDAMLVCCPNPNRAACAEIAKAIVARHPGTFADLTEEGEKLGSGYHSLLTQLKTRVEHVNRNNLVHRIRRPRRTGAGQDGESGSRPARCLRSRVDGYGCVNWQPKELPEGETADSLEAKRRTMAAIFHSLGPDGASVAEVDEHMRLTYVCQRRTINGCPPPTVGEVRERWPFLFTRRWLCWHFHTLTGVDVDSRLSEALRTKGRRIVSFFQSQKAKWSRDVQRLLGEMQGDFRGTDENLTTIAAILLVMKRFKEKEDSLFLSADATATKEDIEEQLTLPVSPRLIMLGSSLLTATRWMVSMEGKVAYVLDGQSDFAAALTVLFSCFYVFNIEYQESACATLELIQRFFARINPEYGIKCTAKVGVSRKSGTIVQRKAAAVNPHVTTFLQLLMEFEWKTSK